MDALIHPRDLEAWHRWQDSQLPLRRRLRRMAGVLRDIARPDARAGQVVVTRGGPEPRVLVCAEAGSPSSVLALLRPLRDLHPEDVVVVAPAAVRQHLPPWLWQESSGLAIEVVPELAAGAQVVLSTGHFLPIGRTAHTALTALTASDPEHAARFVTVQHGLITPHAPPLASGTTLLAWSEADAAYWRSGRDDVETVVVGSQLLWEAAQPPHAVPDPQARPVFLGQLHGAELPREVLAAAAEGFCRAEHAPYRPHPSERDRASLATHREWEASGIVIDRSAVPLRELGAPVVSAFSTGVLEAAAAGLPAWVHCPDPPPWLVAFWERYALAPWGGPPTASPERLDLEPSRAIARVVQGMMSA